MEEENLLTQIPSEHHGLICYHLPNVLIKSQSISISVLLKTKKRCLCTQAHIWLCSVLQSRSTVQYLRDWHHTQCTTGCHDREWLYKQCIYCSSSTKAAINWQSDPILFSRRGQSGHSTQYLHSILDIKNSSMQLDSRKY